MNRSAEILFVSSYPPRECGIASYTQDLVNVLKEKFSNSFAVRVCALEQGSSKQAYGTEVKYKMNTTDESQYFLLAEKINKDSQIKCVFIQHEFGLFSGEFGENLLNFLYMLNKPVITAFHTVLRNPEKRRKEIVQSIVSASDALVVMTESSRKILETDYAVALKKINVIHHGTHLVGESDINSLKDQYMLKDKYVLSTFGLLSAGKSIETALNALPAIIRRFPNTIYQIIGKIHPEVEKQEGDKYLRFLKDKVEQLGISENVRFVNKYVQLDELLNYLKLTDIYLFTSKDPHQAVSGTFAYAMACSCPVISTPIPHAKEMLGRDAGVLFDFQNSEQLAQAVIDLLSDPAKRKSMSLNALHKINHTSWENSAIAHAQLIHSIMRAPNSLIYSVPRISMEHIHRMTTSSGMLQFSDISRPDPESGYTLDDNARALIGAIRHYEITNDESDLPLIDIYLNYIKFSQQKDGSFLNYTDQYGQYHQKNHTVNLEDSMGRAVWALGEAISRGYLLHTYFSQRAENVLLKSLDLIQKFESPRAIAFIIKGLYQYNKARKSAAIERIIGALADKLSLKYRCSSDTNWKWFEDYLTYANSVLPESMLYAYLTTGKEEHQEIARESFDFLLSLTFTEDKIKVISNREWHQKGGEKKHFGEQPIDVAYTIFTLDLFYEIFRNEEFRRKMNVAFSWFHGNNHLSRIIYNPVTGGCQDGLEEFNVNLNQGAESTVCYLLARLIIDKYLPVSSDRKNTIQYIPITNEYSRAEFSESGVKSFQ